jgi:hypothetical protein
MPRIVVIARAGLAASVPIVTVAQVGQGAGDDKSPVAVAQFSNRSCAPGLTHAQFERDRLRNGLPNPPHLGC